jgi:hypothetical protein
MFRIDFFELLFLAEVCIPQVPIARAVFFENLSTIHYQQMNNEQKKKMFDFITKNQRFDITNEDCLNFYNRFNPDNQFNVLTDYQNKKEIKQTYLHKEKYHVTKNQWIDEKYIVSIDKA